MRSPLSCILISFFLQLHFPDDDGQVLAGQGPRDAAHSHRGPVRHRDRRRQVRLQPEGRARVLRQPDRPVRSGRGDCSASRRRTRGAAPAARADAHQEVLPEVPVGLVTGSQSKKMARVQFCSDI